MHDPSVEFIWGPRRSPIASSTAAQRRWVPFGLVPSCQFDSLQHHCPWAFPSLLPSAEDPYPLTLPKVRQGTDTDLMRLGPLLPCPFGLCNQPPHAVARIQGHRLSLLSHLNVSLQLLFLRYELSNPLVLCCGTGRHFMHYAGRKVGGCARKMGQACSK